MVTHSRGIFEKTNLILPNISLMSEQSSQHIPSERVVTATYLIERMVAMGIPYDIIETIVSGADQVGVFGSGEISYCGAIVPSALPPKPRLFPPTCAKWITRT